MKSIKHEEMDNLDTLAQGNRSETIDMLNDLMQIKTRSRNFLHYTIIGYAVAMMILLAFIPSVFILSTAIVFLVIGALLVLVKTRQIIGYQKLIETYTI